MVLVAGPRQVGKTTLAQQILAASGDGLYLNWDNRDDRREIRAARWPGGPSLVVLDELHKWRGWKGWLKGEYDKHRRTTRFLVTGSARLDVYRRGAIHSKAGTTITIFTRSRFARHTARKQWTRSCRVKSSWYALAQKTR